MYKEILKIEDYYIFHEIVGTGLCGNVYRATQILTNTIVAIKVFNKENFSEDSYAKIEREIKILKDVSHFKGVCALFEVIEDRKKLYFVLDYQPNGDLIRYFKSNYLFDESEIKKFAMQIAITLKNIHSKKIIHRDLKFDNILLDKFFNPVITDFGISCYFTSSLQLENQKDTGGTPAYLAPEVLLPDGMISYKTDVWSFGVLLYIMSVGEPPFKADNNQELYKLIVEGKLSFEGKSNVSDKLRRLICKMLTVNVAKRYSLEEVINDPWFENAQDFLTFNSLSNSFDEKKKKEAILEIMSDLGFSSQEILKSLRENAVDHVGACYWSLVKSFS